MIRPFVRCGTRGSFAALVILLYAADAWAGYTTIWDNGPSPNRVDVIFLGDGYTASQIDTVYTAHINAMLAHMFFAGEDPFPRYRNFFNVHRIDMISNESGADVPPEGIFRDTALDARYYGDGVTERLLTINTAKAFNTVFTALAGSGIDPEMRLVSVNSTRYGGSGGFFAVYAGGNTQATEIALHELGHSFSGLADEYGGDPGPYAGAEPSEINVTKSPGGEKWAHWLGYDQPGIGLIGAYEGARYFDTGLYRPSLNSKMRSLFRPFDAVSREKIILDIYHWVDPLDDWLDNGEIVDGGLPLWVQVVDEMVIQVAWYVDDVLVEGAMGQSFLLADHGFGFGEYTVRALAYDDTDWVRINLDALRQDVVWSVLYVPEPGALTSLALGGGIVIVAGLWRGRRHRTSR